MRRTPRHLSAHWSRVACRLRACRRVALFLDFDGTLAPLTPRPQQSRLPARTRGVLRRLARHPRVTVVVISGRRRADLRRRVGLPGIRYLGLYGGEDSRPLHLSMPVRQALDRVGARLAHGLSCYPGVWVENKRVSLTVHLRDAPPRIARRIRREARRVLRSFLSRLVLLENLRDIEIIPRSVAGKGVAVRRVLAQPRLRDALAVYFGDDLSDEPAFAATSRGVSILVRSARPTRAHYTVGGTGQVATWLAQMETALDETI
jgi:trehalose 6-phosphate phosphatase